jgi:hypothetical protein
MHPSRCTNSFTSGCACRFWRDNERLIRVCLRRAFSPANWEYHATPLLSPMKCCSWKDILRAGSEAVMPPGYSAAEGQQCPFATRQEAVRLAQTSGKPIAQIARELGISDSVIHGWRKELAKHGKNAFPSIRTSNPIKIWGQITSTNLTHYVWNDNMFVDLSN